jgi:ABC-type phosphate transport system auxiliary subunit
MFSTGAAQTKMWEIRDVIIDVERRMDRIKEMVVSLDKQIDKIGQELKINCQRASPVYAQIFACHKEQMEVININFSHWRKSRRKRQDQSAAFAFTNAN